MKYFSQFSFDPVEGRLFRGADELPLTRKASTLLGCLIDRAGTWVSKDAIMAAVWPDTYVQPDNIKVLVREIRLALGDAPKAPLYIRSAVGRGYTFVSRISDQAEHRGADAAAGSRAPIVVNRGPELAMLADALDAARASARRLVIVSGEHGSGKSVLCDVFLRGAQVNGPARTSYGQCFDRESDPEPYLSLPRRAGSPRSSAPRPRAGLARSRRADLAGALPAVAGEPDAWRADAGDARGADRPARGAVA